MIELGDNEIIVHAYPVKYSDIVYEDYYVTIQQNRTRRRVPKGFFFYDTGNKIYVSNPYAGLFQHSYKSRKFLVNTATKEWGSLVTTVRTEIPQAESPIEDNEIQELKK